MAGKTGISNALKDVEKAFTEVDWRKLDIGVGTIRSVISKKKTLLAEHKVWRVFSSEGFKPGSDDGTPDKFAIMMPVIKKILVATK